MNNILKNTHKQQNIFLLRVRDYYFNKVKEIDRRMLLVSFIPVFLTILYSILGFDNIWIEIFLGFLSIGFWLISLVIQGITSNYIQLSNRFREKYDNCVFEHLHTNGFEEELSVEEAAAYQSISRKMRFIEKYEIWYGEIFARENREINELANTICCQADNLMYGAHVYERTASFHLVCAIAFSVATLTIAVIAGLVRHNAALVILVPVSVCGAISIIYDKWQDAKNAGQENRKLINLIKSEKIRSRVFSGDKGVLRELQDKIEESRKMQFLFQM